MVEASKNALGTSTATNPEEHTPPKLKGKSKPAFRNTRRWTHRAQRVAKGAHKTESGQVVGGAEATSQPPQEEKMEPTTQTESLEPTGYKKKLYQYKAALKKRFNDKPWLYFSGAGLFLLIAGAMIGSALTYYYMSGSQESQVSL